MSQHRPRRTTTAGRIYLDLQNKARRERQDTAMLHRFYVLERFLARVSISVFAHRLVLKGGALLAAYDARRPTQDLDMLALAIDNDLDTVTHLVSRIAALPMDDGLVFHADQTAAETIREDETYSGVRVTMPATLDRAQVKLKVDVNVGDPVPGGAVPVHYPELLGEGFTICGYPIPVVLAEKIETMIRRADANTRWRDFADVLLLTRIHDLDRDAVRSALEHTAQHRATALEPLTPLLIDLPRRGQIPWARFRTRNQLDKLLRSFADVLGEVCAFTDPVLSTAAARGARWQASARQWNQ